MTILSFLKPVPGLKTGAVAVLSSVLLTACATSPTSPDGSEDVRAKLMELQQNPDMMTHARIELRDAEAAVQLAEQPLDDDEAALAAHRIYMADRMVEIARAKGEIGLLEADRALLGEQRDAARLAARTREADQAHADAESARSAQADAAALASREAEELQRQIDTLEAEATERGLVLTLGDVLFATGSAEIQGGTNQNLEKLANFLKQYPDRNVLIEGHTDNVGSAAFNQNLSRQRAESVRRFLTGRGIESRRLSVYGYGFERPVAINDSATGRQQNRRVEVIIENRE
ncbi:OmpA/MotB domain-containing protein [Marinobacter lipolyticus SM19]|uniref:OmpA/MotB domain-containing protein n=1 Tax=Marinobacter lipolyticus SM19 TaxID=1318628 RepID=R8B0E7_9GAMM|nr:OmpA family protein [Marinobacter lipolyticus]EON92056.1 OmpA/MotB domain-containing protein [Marinobacter lipolyticus SM19]